MEGIISIDDIKKIMETYKIGKESLSLKLGLFKEVTIHRYLEGQVPSKEYSDIIKAALSYPSYIESEHVAQ